MFWKKEINMAKVGDDGIDHNKLRMYRTLKSSFTIEPYIQQVNNRNQRSSITRIRTSAHILGVEQGRYTIPPTPIHKRTCRYCTEYQNNVDSYVDDEFHFMMSCQTFSIKRNCLFGKIKAINKHFDKLTLQQKMTSLLCPSTPTIAKLVNKFICIAIEARKRIDRGENLDKGTFCDNHLNCSVISDSNSSN